MGLEQSASGMNRGALNRLLPVRVWALAFGCVIGWGSFVMPGTTFLPDAGPLGTVIGVAVAAVMTLVICVNYAYLAQRMPVDGGSYAYTKKLLGNDHAFLAVWSLALAYISLLWANATAFVLIGRFFLGDVLQRGFHYTIAGYDIFWGEVLATVLILVLFGLLICFAKKAATVIRTVLAAALFVLIVVLFAGILLRGSGTVSFTPHFSDGASKGTQILNIAILAPWLFVGFETVNFERVSSSRRKVFLYAGAAILTGMLAYIMLTLIGASGVPEGYRDWQEYVSDLGNLRGMEAMPVLFNAESALGIWQCHLVSRFC